MLQELCLMPILVVEPRGAVRATVLTILCTCLLLCHGEKHISFVDNTIQRRELVSEE